MEVQNNGNKENNKPRCWCERPKTGIVCTNCGYVMFGRIRLRCPRHVQTSFLNEISGCANCNAKQNMLMEFVSKSEMTTKSIKESK